MSKASKIEAQLAELPDMPAAELRLAWQEHFGEAAPAVSSNLMRLALGYAAQEQAFGKLPAAQARFLGSGAPLPEPSIQLKPGTRLVREWNGRMHSVLVSDEGFELDGKLYPTLSAVARRITGAHWTCNGFVPVTYLIKPPWLRRRAG